MSNGVDYIWLFLGTRGRLSRYPYFLGGMLISLVAAFPLFRYVIAYEAMEMSQMQFWEPLAQITLFAALWPMFALSAKRVQDFGKPGIFGAATVVPFISILAFPFLCLYPGEPGPNQYGERTNGRP